MRDTRDHEHVGRDSHESFWRLVDAAHDERRDPLEDPEVARRLALDARLWVEYERLERSLRAVERVHAPSSAARVSGAELSGAQHSTAPSSGAPSSTAKISTAKISTAKISTAKISTAKSPTAEISTAEISAAPSSLDDFAAGSSSATRPAAARPFAPRDSEPRPAAIRASTVRPFDTPSSGARRSSGAGWGLRAAAIAAFVLVVLAWARTPRTAAPEDSAAIRNPSVRAPAPEVESAPVVSRVHSLRIDVIDEGPGRRVTTRFDGERRVRTVERLSGANDVTTGEFAVLRSTTITSESTDSPVHDNHR